MTSENERWFNRFLNFFDENTGRVATAFGILAFFGVANYTDLFKVIPYPFEQKISGCITDSKSVYQPISDAKVVLIGDENIGDHTNLDDGCFELGVRWKGYEETMKIKATKIGFCTAIERVDLGSTINFSLYAKEKGRQCQN